MFYTGLPAFAVFLALFKYLEPKQKYWRGAGTVEAPSYFETTTNKPDPTWRMPLIEEFVAILVRLKLGLLLDDISQRFQTSLSHFSCMFTTLLYLEIKLLNPWPSQEQVARHTPQQLMKYRNTCVIIDCTEVLIERKLVEKVRLAPLSEAVIPVRVDQGQANYRMRQKYWSSPGCQQLRPGDAVWSSTLSGGRVSLLSYSANGKVLIPSLSESTT